MQLQPGDCGMQVIRTLAGLPFRAHGPSLLEYRGAFIGFDGLAWRICVRDGDWGVRRFKSAVEAAQLISAAFQQAQSSAQ